MTNFLNELKLIYFQSFYFIKKKLINFVIKSNPVHFSNSSMYGAYIPNQTFDAIRVSVLRDITKI